MDTLQDELIEIAKEAFVTVLEADDDQPEDDPELAPDSENEHVMALEVPPVWHCLYFYWLHCGNGRLGKDGRWHL